MSVYAEAANAIQQVRIETQTQLDVAAAHERAKSIESLQGLLITAEPGTPLYALQSAVYHGATYGREGDGFPRLEVDAATRRLIYAAHVAGILPIDDPRVHESNRQVAIGDLFVDPSGTSWSGIPNFRADYTAWSAANNYRAAQARNDVQL